MMEEKQRLIESIKSELSPEKNSQRTLDGYASSIKTLADDLYSKETHFVFELIQNAEDNAYKNGVTPTLTFDLREINLEGTPSVALIVKNNEIGFEEKHINAICHVGQSTKTKAKGYIGEKGIGFKSVFKITECPYLFSNGYHFRLPSPKHRDAQLGYIVPEWIEEIPEGVDESETTIVLPLKSESEENGFSVDKLCQNLMDIAPETILFLQKIKRFNINIDLSDRCYSVMIEKTSGSSSVVQLHHVKRHDEEEADEVKNYWVKTVTCEKPEAVYSEKRKDILERPVSVALPLDGVDPEEKLFAYLPVWKNTGLPFLINADFLLVSSREGLHEEDSWNQWLRNEIPSVYAKAFLGCLKSSVVSNEQKAAIYGTIPLNSNMTFLESVVEKIHEDLRIEKSILTEPDGRLCLPEKAFIETSGFRDLLTDVPRPTTLNSTRLVRSGLDDLYLSQLEKIGVEPLSFSVIETCLREKRWVSSHDYNWLLSCYQYLANSENSSVNLRHCAIVPIQKGSKTKWSCDAEQPIYFKSDEAAKSLLEKTPSASKVPLAFLDPLLLKKIRDDETVCGWFTKSLSVYDFSEANYAVDLLNIILSQRTDYCHEVYFAD